MAAFFLQGGNNKMIYSTELKENPDFVCTPAFLVRPMSHTVVWLERTLDIAV